MEERMKRWEAIEVDFEPMEGMESIRLIRAHGLLAQLLNELGVQPGEVQFPISDRELPKDGGGYRICCLVYRIPNPIWTYYLKA